MLEPVNVHYLGPVGLDLSDSAQTLPGLGRCPGVSHAARL